MSDTELVNGLRHMADDHPCCEATILHAIDKLQQLERENAALRADKKRLDWLGSQKNQPWLCWETPLRLNRETLDAARKEAQP